jgi:hypothetical protein
LSSWRLVLEQSLLGNELPMPAKQRIGRDDRVNRQECLSAGSFRLCCQAPALIVGQRQTLPGTKPRILFSAWRYSITLRCFRLIQPDRQVSATYSETKRGLRGTSGEQD